jgi:hypothetical protein
LLVFPVALFAFGDPRDGGGDALVAGFRALGFRDPFNVFAFATGAEGCECGCGLLVFAKSLVELGRSLKRRLGRLDDFVTGCNWACVVSAIDECCSLADSGNELFFGRERGDAGDATERAHRAVLDSTGFAEDVANLLTPKAEAAVLFECRHVAEDHAFVFEEWAAPFDGFLRIGAGSVDDFAQVNEDGLGESLRLLDVGVDFGVVAESGHGYDLSGL